MIPAANRKKIKKDRLQKARRDRGREWEKTLCDELNASPDAWAVLLPSGWAGQPYDLSAMVEGVAFGIECKRLADGNLPFSCFTENEKEHLSRYEDAGGNSVVAVLRDSDGRRAFIPWYAIREPILGGLRGSVHLMDFPDTLPGSLEVSRP